MASKYTWQRLTLTAGLTLIFVAYFLVWLPQPVAGLTFIGIDLGEWVKFIPQVQSGELGINRNAFYLPPITLSLLLITWSLSWPERRWKTWSLQLLAIIISLLSLPSIEAFTEEATSEWLTRTVMVFLVIICAILIQFKRFLPGLLTKNRYWFLITAIGMIGAIVPTWTYLVLLDPVRNLLQADVGIGPGVWLNAVGHLIVTGVSVYALTSSAGAVSPVLPKSREA